MSSHQRSNQSILTQKKLLGSNNGFSEERSAVRRKGMQLFLLGVFVILTPSVLALAWLLWQASDASNVPDYEVDR